MLGHTNTSRESKNLKLRDRAWSAVEEKHLDCINFPREPSEKSKHYFIGSAFFSRKKASQRLKEYLGFKNFPRKFLDRPKNRAILF